MGERGNTLTTSANGSKFKTKKKKKEPLGERHNNVSLKRVVATFFLTGVPLLLKPHNDDDIAVLKSVLVLAAVLFNRAPMIL